MGLIKEGIRVHDGDPNFSYLVKGALMLLHHLTIDFVASFCSILIHASFTWPHTSQVPWGGGGENLNDETLG